MIPNNERKFYEKKDGVLFVYESDIEDQSVKEHVEGAMANIISQCV
jgi:hypothetical protein